MVLSKGTVAVTGVSGYLGSWIVETLGQNGYTVRGTVREVNESDKFKKKIKHLVDSKYPVTLCEANLFDSKSFDKCFAGCDYLFHVASPFIFSSDDPQKDIVDPAVEGTKNVLEAAKRAGIKRVVVTSSVAAVRPLETDRNPEKWKGKILNEENWCDDANVETSPYYLSKYLAEKAAWEFCKENGIEMSTINPCMIYGPPCGIANQGSTSVKIIAGFLNGGDLRPKSMQCVDVRDVALAHVKSIETPEAVGQRFIIGTGGPLTDLDIVKILEQDDRFLGKMKQKMPAEPKKWIYDNTRSRKVLGMVYRPISTALLEEADWLVQNGLVTGPFNQKLAWE